MPTVLLTILLTLWASLAWANCVTLDISAWTADQRTYLMQAATTAATEDVDARWVTLGSTVQLCARTADLSGLQSATLRTAAQALHQAQVDADAATAAAETEAVTELDTNLLCRTATLTQILSRIATEKAAVQTDIDAMTNIATGKTAMTTQNNRVWGAVAKLATCIVAYQRYQQLQQPAE